MKKISQLVVVILEQQSSRRSWWEGLKVVYFRKSLESNIEISNGKSGERETHTVREKANTLILPINVIYERI